MEYLKDYFSSESISQIEKEVNVDSLYDLENNEYSVLDNINYLESLGLKNIDKLIIHRPDIFINNKEKLEKFFLEHNIHELVEKINEDVKNIDLFM